jgi:hypothetical protein
MHAKRPREELKEVLAIGTYSSTVELSERHREDRENVSMRDT